MGAKQSVVKRDVQETQPHIFKTKPRYFNYQDYASEENYNDLYHGPPQQRTPDGTQVNSAISNLAIEELQYNSITGYGNRLAGFNQFSMKPLETRNNNKESVNQRFAKGMNRTTLGTPTFYVQPLASRYQILSPRPDEFSITWAQPGDGNNSMDLV